MSLETLPPNTVKLRDGQVEQIQEWVCWNGQDWPTMTIDRNPDGSFTGDIGDPEHGGSVKRGTIEEVTQGLHENFSVPIQEAFSAESIDPATLFELGFRRHEFIETNPPEKGNDE